MQDFILIQQAAEPKQLLNKTGGPSSLPLGAAQNLESIADPGESLNIVLPRGMDLRAHVIAFDPQPKARLQLFLHTAAQLHTEPVVAERSLRKHVHPAQQPVNKWLEFAITPTAF